MTQIFDLKAFRQAHSLSQKDVAEIIGCVQGFISQVESRSKPMPQDKLNILEEKYGDTAAYFITSGDNIESAHDTFQAGRDNNINVSATLEMAIKEISEQRKLTSKAQDQISKSQEQIDRLIGIIENKLSK